MHGQSPRGLSRRGFGIILLASACAGQVDEAVAGTGAESSGTTSTTSDTGSTTNAEDPPEPTTTTSPTSSAATTTDPAPTTTTADTGLDTTTGPTAFDCDTAALCDDFEDVAADGPPDAARWAITSPDCSGTGTIAISDAAAHGGTQSVRIDGGGGYCDHVFLGNADAIEALGDELWLRMWIRFEGALGQGHVTFAALNDAADGDDDLRLGGQSEIVMWNRESDDATLPALSPVGIATSTAPVPGQWTCLEVHLAAAGVLETFVDGVAIDGLRIDGEPTPDIDQQWLQQQPDWAPAVTDLRLGWESYSGQAMVLYIDDVAVHDARIGCD